MKFNSFTSALFIALLFTSCNSQSASVKKLSADQFEKAINAGNAQIIDVRTAEEFKENHIAGAVNIDVKGDNFQKQIESLDKAKPIYIYCKAGGKRSDKAASVAASNGFANINTLDNGLTGWEEGNKPVTAAAGETTGLSLDDYLALLKKSDKLVLVDFNAVWCGPCKTLKPTVTKLAKKNSAKLDLLEIDVDKNPKVSTAMNITGIPLLILYKQGKEVWRNLGLIDENDLAAKLKEFLN